LEWRTLAAIWGAGLSTFLALSSLLPEWPLVTLEPGAPPRDFAPAWVRIRIINPSKKSLVVVRMSQISLRRSSEHLQFFRERDLKINTDEAVVQEIKFAQRAFDKELLAYVPGEKSAVVRIAAIIADGTHVLVFWWHRNWLLGFNLPLCIRVSARVVRQINGG
jgi:hypothetical protein